MKDKIQEKLEEKKKYLEECKTKIKRIINQIQMYQQQAAQEQEKIFHIQGEIKALSEIINE